MELQNLPWYGQLLVFLIVGAILFGIFYFVVYSPNQDEINAIIVQSEKIEADIRLALSKEQKLSKLEEEMASNAEVLEDLKGILPEKQEVSQILRKIQAIASNARLKTSTFTFNNENKRDIYLEWPIAISLEGNYHNLGMFFDQVSRMKKIFTIDSLHISPLGSLNYDYTIQATFVATTYIYREGGTVKKAAPKQSKGKPAVASEGLSPGEV